MILPGEAITAVEMHDTNSLALWCVSLDEYQAELPRLTQYDANRTTIRGLEPARYFLQGLRDEFVESWGVDSIHPSCDRLGVLRGTVEPTRLAYGNGDVHAAVDLDRREFGDVSWYLARLLDLYEIRLSDAVRSNLRKDGIAQQLEPAISGRIISHQYLCTYWEGYVVGAHNVFRAAEDFLWDVNARNKTALLQKAGEFLISTQNLLIARLRTDLLKVMTENISKLNQRTLDGSIFGSGDSR